MAWRDYSRQVLVEMMMMMKRRMMELLWPSWLHLQSQIVMMSLPRMRSSLPQIMRSRSHSMISTTSIRISADMLANVCGESAVIMHNSIVWVCSTLLVNKMNNHHPNHVNLDANNNSLGIPQEEIPQGKGGGQTMKQ
jgi:hypothetical protein